MIFHYFPAYYGWDIDYDVKYNFCDKRKIKMYDKADLSFLSYDYYSLKRGICIKNTGNDCANELTRIYGISEEELIEMIIENINNNIGYDVDDNDISDNEDILHENSHYELYDDTKTYTNVTYKICGNDIIVIRD